VWCGGKATTPHPPTSAAGLPEQLLKIILLEVKWVQN